MRKKGDEFYLNLIVVYIYTIVNIYTYAAAKSLQLCPTLCNPIDSSPPGSPVPGILQARTLEWVAIAFSNIWRCKVKVKSLSRVWLLGTPRTAAYQAPLSVRFSRQEYWSGVPLPSPSNSIYITKLGQHLHPDLNSTGKSRALESPEWHQTGVSIGKRVWWCVHPKGASNYSFEGSRS